MSKDDRMTPVFLSPSKRTIAVFGGGPVALRKCRHFKGFRIKVITEEALPEIEELAEILIKSTISKNNAGQFMDGAYMVIAATSSKVLNGIIRDIAMEKGILVNSAHGGGDVLIPSTLRRGGFTVTVSSEGRAPAFPPYIINQIDNFLDGSYECMLDLLVNIRSKVMEQIPTQPKRAEFMAQIINDQGIWDMLSSGNVQGAMDKAMNEGGLK